MKIKGFYLSVNKLGGPKDIEKLINHVHPETNFVFLFNPRKNNYVWVNVAPNQRKEFFAFVGNRHFNILNLFGEKTDDMQQLTNPSISFPDFQKLVT